MGIVSRLSTNSLESPVEEIVRVWIDVCGIINEKYLIIQGWVFHPKHSVIDFELAHWSDASEKDTSAKIVLPISFIQSTRLDVSKHFSYEGEKSKWGFCLVADWFNESLPNKEKFSLHLKAGNNSQEVELKDFYILSGAELFGHCTTWRSEEKAKLKKTLYRHMGTKVFEIPGLRKLTEEQIRKKANWHWENLLSIPGQGLFLAGWLLDAHQELSGFVLRTADGSYSLNLLEHSVRYSRPDVLEAFSGMADKSYQAGLYSWIKMPHLMERAHLEMLLVTHDGSICELPVEQTIVGKDITLASQQVLTNFNISSQDYQSNMREHVGPALAALWTHRNTNLGEIQVNLKQFGPAVKNPKRSVIVPLYGRYDFLLHQIAQFTKDQDFKDTDLIYVLDDPSLYDEFIPFCHDVSHLFPVSFRVVYGGHNMGYAGANNLGAQYALAENLVLLNSDVIPSESGWLSRIEEKTEVLENVGVVAPKLVFDDETIQHIGINFSKDPHFGEVWLNEHPGKGNPEWLIDLQPVSEFPAVTGACMFIHKSLYELMGGLDETYVLGDFEDTDLCLKLREAGYRHYILGDEKLYHLERQSQNLVENRDWKFKITLYNAWQHTERWGNLIEALVSGE